MCECTSTKAKTTTDKKSVNVKKYISAFRYLTHLLNFTSYRATPQDANTHTFTRFAFTDFRYFYSFPFWCIVRHIVDLKSESGRARTLVPHMLFSSEHSSFISSLRNNDRKNYSYDNRLWFSNLLRFACLSARSHCRSITIFPAINPAIDLMRMKLFSFSCCRCLCFSFNGRVLCACAAACGHGHCLSVFRFIVVGQDKSRKRKILCSLSLSHSLSPNGFTNELKAFLFLV